MERIFLIIFLFVVLATLPLYQVFAAGKGIVVVAGATGGTGTVLFDDIRLYR